ncbi:acetyl-CoA acetyltransferase, cytosolic 1-like isoform X3 [Durio zibethinus]|uniref:Acetyl-CoA acetyltransferase, cytosolic 1-like isoform X3 n=1 Tax=Durio zibethinus TaxID=66656 RepID=A0A6P5X0N8_DURZI|nr:acetyl-CoA acetyltransferase, cytosolic 1-like isoform X3 [Durio zibethinus]
MEEAFLRKQIYNFFSIPLKAISVRVSRGKGKSSTIVDNDEGLGKFDAAKLKKMRPSFKESGTLTAGNASSISPTKLGHREDGECKKDN